MKLPERREKAVENLRSVSPEAHRAVGQAQAKFAGAVGDTVDNIHNQMVNTDYNAGVTEANARVDALKKDIDRNAFIHEDELPEGVTPKQVGEDGMVRMQDIATDLFRVQSTAILNEVKGKARTYKAKKRLGTDISSKIIYPGSVEVEKSVYLQRMARTKAVLLGSFNEAISNGNEGLARNILIRGLESNSFTEADFVEEFRRMGSELDENEYIRLSEEAKTPEDLEEVRRAILYGRVDPETGEVITNRFDSDTMQSLMKAVDGRESDLKKIRDIVQTQTHGEAVTMGIDRTLTPDWIKQKISNGELSPSVGTSLLNGLRTRQTTPVINNLIQRDKLITETIGISNTSGGQFTVSANADRMRVKTTVLATGVNANGVQVHAPLISGSDYKAVMAEIDANEKRALTTLPRYKQAMDTLAKTAGISAGMITNLTSEGEPKVEAYILQRQALNRYMDMYGEEAKPMEYINTLMSEINQETVEGNNQERFTLMFPEYAPEVDQTTGVAATPMSKQEIIKDIYERATDPRREDAISHVRMERMIWQMYGNYHEVSYEDLRSAENPEEFYQNLKDQNSLYGADGGMY
jgi:hypothetical protein